MTHAPTQLLDWVRYAWVPDTWYQVLGTKVRGSKHLVPLTGYQILGTKILDRSAWYQVLPTTEYQVLGTMCFCTKYLGPSTWQQALGSKHLVPSTSLPRTLVPSTLVPITWYQVLWYQVLGTNRLVPILGTRHICYMEWQARLKPNHFDWHTLTYSNLVRMTMNLHTRNICVSLYIHETWAWTPNNVFLAMIVVGS